MNFVDAHCHLADSRFRAGLQQELQAAAQQGVSHFVSTALNEQELHWHLDQEIKSMYLAAGIHPYLPQNKNLKFNTLIKLCDEQKISFIGEIGLDKRGREEEQQRQTLLQQLDLASNYNLPVIFHVVGKYYELHKLLKNNFPKIRGYLHGFKASLETAQQFAGFDLAFSLGGKPPQDAVILYLIRNGMLLFETDAPFQKPVSEKDEYNHLKNLSWILDKTMGLSGLTKDELEKMQKKTFYLIRDKSDMSHK